MSRIHSKRVGRCIAISALAAGTLAGTTPSEMASADSSRLHSARWLYDHCKIRVTVNVSSRILAGRKDGVSLRGVPKNDSGGHPESVYHWHIPKGVQFCGITGSWSLPSREIALRPTSESAEGGEYTDHTVNNLDADK